MWSPVPGWRPPDRRPGPVYAPVDEATAKRQAGIRDTAEADCRNQAVRGGFMRRVQVNLGDEDFALLERAVRATDASRSELIRRAVRQAYETTATAEKMSTVERLQALRKTAGAWSDRQLTGAQYVDAVRGDLNERLRKLGME